MTWREVFYPHNPPFAVVMAEGLVKTIGGRPIPYPVFE